MIIKRLKRVHEPKHWLSTSSNALVVALGNNIYHHFTTILLLIMLCFGTSEIKCSASWSYIMSILLTLL